MPVFSVRLSWAALIFLTTAQAIQVAPLDTVRIGPYYAQNCKSNNNNIATLLTTLSRALQPVVTDLGSSSSSNAYTTFFKDIAYAPYVRAVFANITKGVSVPPEPGRPSSEPVFICVDARGQVTFNEDDSQVDAYARCRDHGEAPALTLLTTPYIIICPVFFNQAVIPIPSAASCLTVDPHRNRFVQDGKSLIKYQLWHILHELVHYYVYSTKENVLDIYGINACLALVGRGAVLNAQSYVYYVANLWLGCTKFPTVRTRPPGQGAGIELLETDANSAPLTTNETIAPAVQNLSIHAPPPVQASEDFGPNLTS